MKEPDQTEPSGLGQEKPLGAHLGRQVPGWGAHPNSPSAWDGRGKDGYECPPSPVHTYMQTCTHTCMQASLKTQEG